MNFNKRMNAEINRWCPKGPFTLTFSSSPFGNCYRSTHIIMLGGTERQREIIMCMSNKPALQCKGSNNERGDRGIIICMVSLHYNAGEAITRAGEL